MPTELRMLILSIVLGLIHIVLSSHAASLQRGYRWSAGPRDEHLAPLQGAAGRIDRALRNFLETFPLFAAAVIVAHLLGRHNWMTVWGSQLYFWARLAYVPLYVLGVPVVRSLVWNVSFAGIVLLLIAIMI
jgi:uncharacterized MAPEG superfamily protein